MIGIRPAACLITLAVATAAATSKVKVTFSQSPSVNTITVDSPVKIEGLKADVLTRDQTVTLRAMPAGGGGDASVSIREEKSVVDVNGEVALLMESQFVGAGGPTEAADRVVAFPWWVIIKENVQIGADGTKVFVRATENKQNDGSVRHNLFVMLREGGDARVRIGFGENTKDHHTLVLKKDAHQHHYFEIVFDVANGVRTLVSVNGDQTNPADAEPIPLEKLDEGHKIREIVRQVRQLEEQS